MRRRSLRTGVFAFVWFVVAGCSGGSAGGGSSSGFSPTTPIEAEPVDLDLSAVPDDEAVHLSWTAGDATRFSVHRAHVGEFGALGGDEQALAVRPPDDAEFVAIEPEFVDSQYTDVAVTNDQVYFYRVAVTDSDGVAIAVTEPVIAVPFERSGTVDVRIAASRSSGVAPMAVFFDATESTSLVTFESFHELEVRWNFDDPGAGTWTVSGLSRNGATGALAGHVFSEPGTYVVRATVRDADGNASVGSTTITVTDPEDVFSGDRTIAFSTAGNFTGAPAGATQITTSSFADVMARAQPGMRLLLRRGETWSANDSSYLNCAGPGLIGAFGAGSKPVISARGSQPLFGLSGAIPELEDWRIVDLHIAGSAAERTVTGFSAYGTVRQLLVQRVDFRDVESGFMFSPSVLDYNNANGFPGHTLNDEIAFIDNTLEEASFYGAYVAATRFLFLGNDFYGGDSNTAHVTRFPFIQQAVIGHCSIAHPGNLSGGAVKIHAGLWDSPGIGYGEYTEDVIIADNEFVASDNQWLVVIGPQSGRDVYTDHLRDFLIERNAFLGHATTYLTLRITASHVTVRNNIFNTWNQAIDVTPYGSTPDPTDIVVANNSAYFAGIGSFTFVHLAAGVTNALVANNLLSAPSTLFAEVYDGGATDVILESNLVTSEATFVEIAPVVPADFMLIETSPAVDAGSVTRGVFEDFAGTVRRALDVGAFEWEG